MYYSILIALYFDITKIDVYQLFHLLRSSRSPIILIARRAALLQIQIFTALSSLDHGNYDDKTSDSPTLACSLDCLYGERACDKQKLILAMIRHDKKVGHEGLQEKEKEMTARR